MMNKEPLIFFKNLSLIKIQKAAFLQLAILVFGQKALREVFYWSLGLLGQANLSVDNLTEILANPKGLAILMLYGFFAVAIIHIEFYCLFQIIKGEPFIRKGSALPYLKNLWRLFGGWNLPAVLLYLLVTIPVLQLVLPTIVTSHLIIPKFIIGELGKTFLGKAGLAVGYAMVFYFNLRLMFTIPFVIIRNESVLQSMKKSWQIKHAKLGRTALSIVLQSSLLAIVVLVILSVLVVTVNYLDPKGNHLFWQTIFLSLSWAMIFLGHLLVKMLIAESLGHALALEKVQQNPSRLEKYGLALGSLILSVGVVLLAILAILSLPEDQERQVIAHRGMVTAGVENSIEALEASAKNGADYVEMDIIMTKDGQFVVSHDNKLKRLAGVNRKVSEMSLKEVAGIPIYQGQFSSRLVSFEDYVARAKQLGIKLLVELKPTGDEPANYADTYIAKFKELGLDQLGYKSMSLDGKLMEDINQKMPEMKTGHVIPLQFGFFGNENVDFYVIEDFSYRPSLSYQANLSGKEVYVWTINDSSRMEYYLQQPVDGLITDYPDQLQELDRAMKKEASLFDRVLRVIQENF